jgi:DNA-binding transcriptional LysR family regulator
MPFEKERFHYKNNRLQQLRGFCFAAQYGSLSKAAKAMGLSHSAVSLQIKTLEQDFATILIKRTRTGITLTEDGELLYKMATPCIGSIDDLYKHFHQHQQQVSQEELCVSTNNCGLNFILPTILMSYLHEQSERRCIIRYAEHEEALTHLLDGTTDLVLLPKRLHLPFPKMCHYTPWRRYRPVLLTPKDHPLAGKANLSIADICQYELIFPAEGWHVIPHLKELLTSYQKKKRQRIQFINWEVTKRYIEHNLAISISSDIVLTEHDVLVGTDMSHLFPWVEYGFLTRNSPSHHSIMNEFLDCAFAVRDGMNLPKEACIT